VPFASRTHARRRCIVRSGDAVTRTRESSHRGRAAAPTPTRRAFPSRGTPRPGCRRATRPPGGRPTAA